ncbi:hypothetical protein LCI18_007233 [Fusarium solani-melongenae]|uniref:Uncharacterized protein n=1 Tax=Fusarium solani subsp. cucurbitae TaxID=2747967 RepID=A0ACD3Z5E3_FUSSC|nr:hypothetical protein LCI18_007233 [Fusarium solani-melongenae]
MSSSYRRPGLGELSAEWKEVSSMPLTGDPVKLREAYEKLLATEPADPVRFSIKTVSVLGYGGYKNQVRIYEPDRGLADAPVLIYVHGGGWTVGSLDSEDPVCRAVCRGNNIIVVSVDYRKAPENPFPTGLEDVWAAVLWVFDNLNYLGTHSDKIIMGGLSAGANITAALTHRAKEAKLALKGQILRIPMVVHPEAQPAGLDFGSYQENVNSPLLSVKDIMQTLEWYKPVPTDLRMSPLLAQDFSELPPAYFQVAGADPLRDDAFAYMEKLEQAGVPVRASIYSGQPHGFMNLPSDRTTKSNEDLIEAVKWLIGDE